MSMNYGLKHFKAVIIGMPYACFRELGKWEGWPDGADIKALLDQFVDWAEQYEDEEDFEVTNQVETDQLAQTTRDIKADEDASAKALADAAEKAANDSDGPSTLDVSPDVSHMFIGILVEADKAEQCQKGLPDIPGVMYAADWVGKGELSNPNVIKDMALKMWEQFCS